MPYQDPEPEDPLELIGIELPGDEAVTREMAEVFADEFAQLGFGRAQILALFRTPHYAGAHKAWQLLGEDEIARVVGESVSVYGRVTCAVTDWSNDDHEPQPLRFFRRWS